MYEALAEFEGLCARLSAVRMTALEKKRLELLNESRESRLAKGDRDDLAAINTEFHEAIYQGSHSPSIAERHAQFPPAHRVVPRAAIRAGPDRACVPRPR